MAAPKVVPDTNVILQAMMGSRAAWTVLRGCMDGRLRLIYSQKLMYEVTEKAQTTPRVKARVPRVSFLRVSSLIGHYGRCARDPRLGPPYTRIANDASDEVPNDRDDHFIYALAASTGSVIISSDNDFDHVDRLGIPRLSLQEAAAALRNDGRIEVALADRHGQPQLLLP